jgi:competence protein ComFC
MLGRALNKVGTIAVSLYDDFKEFLSPSACLCCGKDRDFPDLFLCHDCLLKLKSFNIGNGPVCPFCGRPSGAASPCSRCADSSSPELFFWGIYENELQECLLQFKFHRAHDLGRRLTEMAIEPLCERLRACNYDIIIPVPLHKSREKERLYNQSEVISAELSRQLGISHKPELLFRKRHTQQQAKLEENHRWENVKDAFDGTDSFAVAGKRILLVDDIVTTGATIYEASRPLLNAGASRLDIFSLAYAK